MTKILDNGVWVDGTPTIGQVYRKYDAGGGFSQSVWQGDAQSFPVFTVINPAVTAGGEEIIPSNGFYYVQKGVPIQMVTTAQLENGETITLPPPLALPIVMFDAKNSPTTKRYASTSISNGVITANITIDESGAWKISEDFVNESLAEVNQPFRVSMSTFTFLVM